jgi:hypothetical protein
MKNSSILAVITASILSASLSGCGESPSDANKKLAISCVSGAPVCEDVSMLGLEPDLAKKVKALQEKNRKDKEKNQRSYTPPPQSYTPPPQQSTSTTSDNQRVADAALAITAACGSWQIGAIQRAEIMGTAKLLYAQKGNDPGSVDWSRAIDVAVKLDKQEGLGCLE